MRYYHCLTPQLVKSARRSLWFNHSRPYVWLDLPLQGLVDEVVTLCGLHFDADNSEVAFAPSMFNEGKANSPHPPCPTCALVHLSHPDKV